MVSIFEGYGKGFHGTSYNVLVASSTRTCDSYPTQHNLVNVNSVEVISIWIPRNCGDEDRSTSPRLSKGNWWNTTESPASPVTSRKIARLKRGEVIRSLLIMVSMIGLYSTWVVSSAGTVPLYALVLW